MKVHVNPTTGRMETTNDAPSVVTAEDVARTRRELREMIAGNVQFHDDRPKQTEPPMTASEIAERLSLCLTCLGRAVVPGRVGSFRGYAICPDCEGVGRA